MMYVGVDVHKKVCRAAMANDEGELVEEFSFTNSKKGIEAFMMKIEAFKERVLVAVESTANLWIRLYDSLEERGIRVVLSNPSKTRLIAEARVKTDKVDARILAQLLRADMLPLCFVPNRMQRDRRQFIRHRIHLVKMRTEVKNRIHALLDKHGLKCPYPTLFSKKGVEWLRSLKLGFTDDAVFRSDQALLEALDEQIGFVDAKIASVAVNDERVKLLMTMPGLDYFAASLLVAEVCDISRFSSDKKLVSWAGLAPGVHQSGEKAVHGRITKQGNRLVRWVMVQAAQTAVRHDERFKEFYGRYSGRKGPQKAVVAVAHEMLRIVYFMLKKNESYRGEKRDLSWRKLKRLERKSIAGLQV
jgi:transposase